MEYIQVITTAASQQEAENIAAELLQQRLAACVQIVGPITSLYRWREKIEKEPEYRCEIKSRSDLFPQIEELLARIHPYEVPELVALPYCATSAAFGQWLGEELQ
ncbi:MAG: divalent-cation tolerance protein CutA [Desulfurivibrio sp.]|nr:divalent-cation tolerance protein CutA [Desulfurivibrio sp.]